jgi:hypothetical protein
MMVDAVPLPHQSPAQILSYYRPALPLSAGQHPDDNINQEHDCRCDEKKIYVHFTP